MRTIKGSSSVELVFLLMFILMFVAIMRRFSYDAQDSHKLLTDLQIDTEKMMVEHGRPVCLEKINEKKYLEFANSRQRKALVYVTKNICDGENAGQY